MEAAPIDGGNCLICKQEKHAAKIYRWKLIGGLLLPYTLASLDLTIVATSLPFIASYYSTSPCISITKLAASFMANIGVQTNLISSIGSSRRTP
jgi:hypothetical protein